MGEARRRGSREQRAAEAIERQRLADIEAERERIEGIRRRREHERTRKFMEVKERIETRHLWRRPKPRQHRPSPRRMVSGLGMSFGMMAATAMMLAPGPGVVIDREDDFDKPWPPQHPRR